MQGLYYFPNENKEDFNNLGNKILQETITACVIILVSLSCSCQFLKQKSYYTE